MTHDMVARYARAKSDSSDALRACQRDPSERPPPGPAPPQADPVGAYAAARRESTAALALVRQRTGVRRAARLPRVLLVGADHIAGRLLAASLERDLRAEVVTVATPDAARAALAHTAWDAAVICVGEYEPADGWLDVATAAQPGTRVVLRVGAVAVAALRRASVLGVTLVHPTVDLAASLRALLAVTP